MKWRVDDVFMLARVWLLLIFLALSDGLTCAQSHLPSPSINNAEDLLAWQRENDLLKDLGIQGIDGVNWGAGTFGLYSNNLDGKPIWNTNTDQFWRGAWKEDTNGWRVEINFLYTNTPDIVLAVSIGSVVTNSDDGTGDYFQPPTGELAEFKLLSPDGTIVAPVNPYTSFDHDWPKRIPVKLYPGIKVGPLAGEFWFLTNGPPFCVADYNLSHYYPVTNEGDYTVIVRPVLYHNLTGGKIDVSGGNFHQTNTNYFDRVDFPEVSAKVHLVPNKPRHANHSA